MGWAVDLNNFMVLTIRWTALFCAMVCSHYNEHTQTLQRCPYNGLSIRCLHSLCNGLNQPQARGTLQCIEPTGSAPNGL
eukprot:4163166-Lingulodinium_polyedra.AAC.1